MSMAQEMSAAENSALLIGTVEVGPWHLDQQLAACCHPDFSEVC